jgi:hypothetical protein
VRILIKARALPTNRPNTSTQTPLIRTFCLQSGGGPYIFLRRAYRASRPVSAVRLKGAERLSPGTLGGGPSDRFVLVATSFGDPPDRASHSLTAV